MFCKTTSLSYEIKKKNFLFRNLFLMIFGGVLGAMLARNHLGDTLVASLTLQELLLFVSRRDILSLIFTDALFSVLILICSFFGRKSLFYSVLFFLKGFCISYFCFLFLCFFQSRGFLLAFFVLLFHSFLLLPLQLVTAFVLSAQANETEGRKPFLTYLALNSGGVVLCVFLERLCYPLLPSML